MKFAIEVHKEQGKKRDIDVHLTSENAVDRALMTALHEGYLNASTKLQRGLENDAPGDLWIEFRPRV